MSSEISCWQCSEHCNKFSYVLNIIIELKKKKISSSFENILDRLNVGEEPVFIAKSLLEDILAYALKSLYLCTSTYKNNVSYRINDKEIDFQCINCGEKLTPYTENYPSNRSVEYVDRETFESLAREIYMIKSELLQIKNKSNPSWANEDDDYTGDLIKNLKEEISSLSNQVTDKDRQILFLVKYISENSNVTVPLEPSTNHVSMETSNNLQNVKSTFNWQSVNNSRSHSNHYNKRGNKINDILLQNRFEGLVNQEINTSDNYNHFNENQRSERNGNIYNNKRPSTVINEHGDNDIMFTRENVVKKTHPGNSSYADISSRGKKICLLGSSIIQRVKMNDFNHELNDGSAIKRSFAGCTTTRMKYYAKEVLEEEHPDTIILHIGGNDLSNPKSTAKNVLEEIINIIQMCRNGGVNDIIVSAITSRPSCQVKIDEVNRLLKNNANTHNYIFCDNLNIQRNHLWKDKIHLNNEGMTLLVNNYLDILLKHPHFYNFY